MTDDTDSPKSIGWAVVGLGRAGRARRKHLENSPDATIEALVSRRPGQGNATVEDVCANPLVDAVVVCTENATHADLAQRFLEAEKHVLVEYPLANSAAKARALFDLAYEKGRVLQVELIGLLTERHRAMDALLLEVGCTELELSFTGASYGWVEAEARAGHWGQLAIARLHTLDDWFGALRLCDASLSRDSDGYCLRVELRPADGTPITLVERRGRDLRRARTVSGRLGNGDAIVEPQTRGTGDLFGQDLEVFVHRIRGERAESYVGAEQVVRTIGLAEAINAAVALESG